jgi:hypothetical protein
MKLKILQIEQIAELKSTSCEMKNVINIFISAMNDWPKVLTTLDDYENQVREFISANTSKENIITALTSIDFNKNAWESESLSQIIEVFDFFDEGLSLKDIIYLLERKFFS